MNDIIDLIKNLQTLTVNDSAFKILKDFERVLDELDLYVYKNWEDGELWAGPEVGRYHVTCKFMWQRDKMPDPLGANRLLDYGGRIIYEKTHLMIPRKVKDPSDYRPGTKKGKIDLHPVWLVSVTIPKKLMHEVYQGYINKESTHMANLMRHDQPTSLTPDQVPSDPDQGMAPMPPAQGMPNAGL